MTFISNLILEQLEILGCLHVNYGIQLWNTTDLFYGDGQPTKNPHTFLRFIKADIACALNVLNSEKCEYFYNYCSRGYDAKEWYEELEENSPKILNSWPLLVKHFCIQWLGTSQDILSTS